MAFEEFVNFDPYLPFEFHDDLATSQTIWTLLRRFPGHLVASAFFFYYNSPKDYLQSFFLFTVVIYSIFQVLWSVEMSLAKKIKLGVPWTNCYLFFFQHTEEKEGKFILHEVNFRLRGFGSLMVARWGGESSGITIFVIIQFVVTLSFL